MSRTLFEFLSSNLQRFSPKHWGAVKNFAHPRVVTMLFFGFSAGLPILLIFSSLSLWLREAGVQRSAVTFFSWAALGYSFKFIWAPLVDQMPIPMMSRMLGRRRAWILLAQIGITASIFAMSMIDPAKGQNYIVLMALAAVGLGFSSATQDISIDAYRIESADESLQALMASVYIAGYRIGMLAAGAGALFLAQIKGSTLGAYDYTAWRMAYQIMAGLMAIGIITVFVIKEPEVTAKETNYGRTTDHARFFILFLVSAAAFVSWFYFTSGIASTLKEQVGFIIKNTSVAGFIIETIRLAAGIGAALLGARMMVALKVANMEMIRSAYVEPVSDFFSRYGARLAWLLLALIGLYRISDIVLGVISNVFYQDMGFSKIHIASIVKTFGLFMTIAGGFLGGTLSIQFGVMRILFVGALLSALTNLLFVLMAWTGPVLPMLYLVISADNLAGGLAGAAFVAFLSSLTNVRFTAIQYAVFSSLMTLVPKMFSGYSGSIVDQLGYPVFFTVTAVMGIPVLILILICGARLQINETKN
ncbi:AmpG family muropeptide MFS transporter [uncultured Desulfobacter sp.]|uniref:AmpG family muropeptide MFS transporter n=1 Tax=uncultured Desulfobacter sp. TaxID=240139 RepID=UPI0029F489E2|nr:MFS transporter [uncultured Desulfobacter sp.]